MIKMPWTMYVKEVLLRALYVFIPAFIPPLMIYLLMPSSIVRFILLCVVSLIASCMSIYWLGLQAQEKVVIMGVVKKYLHREKQ